MKSWLQDTNLVLWYPMTEGTGTTVHDYKGGNNGTISGATWEKIPFQGGYGIKFSSANDYLYNDTFLDTNLPDTLTISCWVMKDDAFSNVDSISEYFISKENINAADRISIYYNEVDGTITAYTEANNGGIKSVSSIKTSWLAGEWIHVVYVAWGTNGSKLYINGELNDSDATVTTKMNAGTHTDFIVGNHYDLSDSFDLVNGIVDNVMLWSRELSLEEVKYLHRSTYRT